MYIRGFFSTPDSVIVVTHFPKERTFEVEKAEFFSQKAEFFSQKAEFFSQKAEFFSQKADFFSQRCQKKMLI